MDPVLPLLCRLLISPTPFAPPVEARGVGYRPQPVGFAPVDAEVAANVGPVRFPGLDACTAVGVEVEGGGRRVWAFPTAGPVDVPAGAEVVVPAGVLVVLAEELVVVRALVEAAAATGGDCRGTVHGSAGRRPAGAASRVGAGLGHGAAGRSQADTRS